MENCDQESERRQVDASGLKLFLSRIYEYMALAVFISATSAYLTMTFFARSFASFIAAHQWEVWLLILLPIVYGVTFAFLTEAYSGHNVASATVFVIMAIIGTVTKKDLSRIGSYASAALIGLIVAMLANLFLHNPIIDYVFSIIAVIIFTILTAWDAQRMKDIYLQYGDDLSTNGLAVLGALQLYLDFVNLFLQFLDIFGANEDK